MTTIFAQENNLNETISIRHLIAQPGEVISGAIDISNETKSSFVPITIINGIKPGPTLVVLAGIHGSEYSPIIALQRLMPQLKSENLSGAVIAVHIANMPSYLGRTIYTSPVDGKNLNRVFPGKSEGTLTERIASFITQEVYPYADAVLDMHSGDGNEQLKPSWVGYYAQTNAVNVVEASRKMALAFGLDYVVEFAGNLSTKEDAIWAGSAAVALGIPSIDVEAGGMGVIDVEAISRIEQGVRRIMDHLGILSASFPPIGEPNIIRERVSVTAPSAGSWFPLVDANQKVVEGELIGYMTDWYGKRIFEARAPINGLLILRLEAPPVLEGETLITVAKIE